MSKKALIASHNPIKAYATEDALQLFSGEFFDVRHVDLKVESSVSDQPMSLAETARGALCRLSQIRSIRGYAYYVAIEGGAFPVEVAKNESRWYETACAAVSDGSESPASVAYGPSYPIPPRIVAHLIDGMDLNQAMEIETGVAEIGNTTGFNGWLTEGRMDRQEGSKQAVLLALYGLKHIAKPIDGSNG